MCFVGFYSVPNLVVILFNLLYPVFIVRFNSRGCVIGRDSVKTQEIEDKRVFAGISQLSILRNDAYALHMTGMRKVRTDGDSCVSRVAYGLGLPTKHSRNICFARLCYLIHTYVPTLYIPTLPTKVEECFREKTLATNLERDRKSVV